MPTKQYKQNAPRKATQDKILTLISLATQDYPKIYIYIFSFLSFFSTGASVTIIQIQIGLEHAAERNILHVD